MAIDIDKNFKTSSDKEFVEEVFYKTIDFLGFELHKKCNKHSCNYSLTTTIDNKTYNIYVYGGLSTVYGGLSTFSSLDAMIIYFFCYFHYHFYGLCNAEDNKHLAQIVSIANPFFKCKCLEEISITIDLLKNGNDYINIKKF